jgi:DNA polymerase I
MERDPEKTFYLIDGSSYIYRAFYAIRRLTNSRGMATHAVYGFLTMLLKVLRERTPGYISVVFDSPGKTFRHEISEEYKATRQAMPEELVPQIPYIKDVVRYCGVDQMELQGYEADDLIATLTAWAADGGLDVVIVSSDKDLHYLIKDPVIRQWDPQNDRVFTEKEVAERFGITPRQMQDYLALVGDSSDNVPGVKGVGDKTAQKLLQRWGSLDVLYQHAGEVTPESLKKKLQEGRESAYLSRELVAFKTDVPVEKRIEDFAPGAPMFPEMVKLCEELEFKSILESLRKEWGQEVEALPPPPREPRSGRPDRIVRTREELSALVRELEGRPLVALEIVASPQDPLPSEPVAVAVSFGNDSAHYVPLAHCGPDCGVQLDREEALRALAPVLRGAVPAKAGHNLKSQYLMLKRAGLEMKGGAFDTMIASYLLDPGKQTHGLDRMAAEFLGETIGCHEDLTGKGKGRIGFAEVDIGEAAALGCCDVETIWRLVPVLREKLDAAGLGKLHDDIELPLTGVLAEMEYRGVLVDSEKLETLALEFEKALDQRAGIIFEMAGEEFNIQSPKQLAAILFDKLRLRILKKTKSGPSTDTSVLEELAFEHPIADHVLSYRMLAKLKGTYADSLPKLVNPATGRIHTSFNQTVAATGRLSSSNPNLQNIPIRTAEGRKIREAFIAPPGWMLLSADYSQIELRVLAHCSGDEHLVDAFLEDEDVHRRTAAEVFGVPPLEVTPEMRRQAKMINFGIIYGMGAFGLARRLRINTRTAKEAIDRYFGRYRGVRRFIDEAIEKARDLGYAETLLGRKRAIPELQSRNFNIRQLGERLAINTPLQGTAADLIKKAMIDVVFALKREKLETRMLLQVHDELVFETPQDELETARALVKKAMEEVWELSVPLRVDFGSGPDWAHAHA